MSRRTRPIGAGLPVIGRAFSCGEGRLPMSTICGKT